MQFFYIVLLGLQLIKLHIINIENTIFAVCQRQINFLYR